MHGPIQPDGYVPCFSDFDRVSRRKAALCAWHWSIFIAKPILPRDASDALASISIQVEFRVCRGK